MRLVINILAILRVDHRLLHFVHLGVVLRELVFVIGSSHIL